jgi:hypothetical protein
MIDWSVSLGSRLGTDKIVRQGLGSSWRWAWCGGSVRRDADHAEGTLMGAPKRKHGPDQATMGARIRAERKRLGLAQLEATGRIGMGQQNYRRLELNANPCYGTIVGLVRLVGRNARAIAPELF